jgi:hypothetical protein
MSSWLYRSARMDPGRAMPNAPPISRVVSFTADATPCFSSGTTPMIAEVVGAVHNPSPKLSQSTVGASRSRDPDTVKVRTKEPRQAVALLLGPVVLGKISTLTDFDYRNCARAAVDGFLATHGHQPPARPGATTTDR